MASAKLAPIFLETEIVARAMVRLGSAFFLVKLIWPLQSYGQVAFLCTIISCDRGGRVFLQDCLMAFSSVCPDRNTEERKAKNKSICFEGLQRFFVPMQSMQMAYTKIKIDRANSSMFGSIGSS
ncbi:MAG: hypothetical protein R3A45_06795 [Bdellovibrionota bacterium]